MRKRPCLPCIFLGNLMSDREKCGKVTDTELLQNVLDSYQIYVLDSKGTDYESRDFAFIKRK